MTPTMTSRLRLLGLLLTLLCVSALSAAAPGWMVLFGTPDCDDCRAFKEDWADTAGFETEAVLVFVDVAPLSGYRRFSELEEALGGDQERSTAFPVILVGGKFHFGAEGLDRVREEAGELLKTAWPSHPLLTDIRQEDAVRRTLEAVRRAREALSAGLTPDAVVTDIEDGLNALGELTGRTAREDIVERIFSRFCVGK